MRAMSISGLALLTAGTLAACGGGSGASAVRIPGSAPAGRFTTYVGSGFSLSVPGGWRRIVVGPTSDGRIVVSWTAPGSTSANVDVSYYPHPQQSSTTLAGFVSSLEQSEKYVAANLRLSSLEVRAATVQGAAQAKLISELGSSSDGPHVGRLLLVRTQPGPLVVVSATRYAGNTTFVPLDVIDSFRLTGTV